MSNRHLLKDVVHKRALKKSGRLSLRRLSAWAGVCLGAVVLAIAMLILMFGGTILNGYGKGKAEPRLRSM